MKCPNPACKHELFKVNVAWKERLKEFPAFVPVSVNCAKCGRQIQAYMTHKDMKAILTKLVGIEKIMFELLSVLEEKEPETKGLLRRLLRSP